MSRTEAFPPDGKRRHVSPGDVAIAWRSHTSSIPAQYAVATAAHESAFTLNEVDTEESGFVSLGVFQLSREEARNAGMADADLLDLDVSCKVLASAAEKRLAAICAAAKVDPSAAPADAWFFLALAHNQGLGACLKTIAAHGLDAAGYTARNPQLAQACRYFNDCITGGEFWRDGL